MLPTGSDGKSVAKEKNVSGVVLTAIPISGRWDTEMYANAHKGKEHRKDFCRLWYQQWSEEISHIHSHSLGIFFTSKYTAVFLEWNNKIPIVLLNY